MRGYNQVSYDFIQDSNRKPVLTGPPSPFSLFLLPHLMDTIRIWYLWKGIFKDYLGVVVTLRGARTISHGKRRHLPEHGLQHTLSIYLNFIRDHPHLDLSPFHYSSSMTVLHRF